MRQQTLKGHHDFTCSCEACAGSYPFSLHYQMSLPGIQLSQSPTISGCKKSFKKNCKDISKSQKKPSNLELNKLMDVNLYLLSIIAKVEPFVFLK
jgi:hypothetical protein